MDREWLKRVIQLAWPIALQSALVSLLSLADVMMVGRLGPEPMAAVGAATKWQFVAIMIMAGLATANGMMVAQFWGKHDITGAQRVHWMSVGVGAVLMVPVTIGLVGGAPWLLGLATDNNHVILLGSDYLLTSWPLLLLTHLVMVGESSLRASGNVRLPLYLAAITIAFNVLLNALLINGWVLIPAMGVAGAALGTTLARTLQLGLMVGALWWQRHWLSQLRALAITRQRLITYCRQALPLMGSVLTWALGSLTYQLIVGQLGTDALAVFSLLSPVESLCFAVFFGLTAACSVLIGQSLGRDDFIMAQTLASTFVWLIPLMALGLGGVLWLMHYPLLSLLGVYDNGLAAIATPMFAVICGLLWIKTLSMVLINGILRPGGDNHFCLRADVAGMWLTGVPLTALAALYWQWPLFAVYLMTFTEEVVKDSLCWRRYLSRKWQRNLTHLYR